MQSIVGKVYVQLISTSVPGMVADMVQNSRNKNNVNFNNSHLRSTFLFAQLQHFKFMFNIFLSTSTIHIYIQQFSSTFNNFIRSTSTINYYVQHFAFNFNILTCPTSTNKIRIQHFSLNFITKNLLNFNIYYLMSTKLKPCQQRKIICQQIGTESRYDVGSFCLRQRQTKMASDRDVIKGNAFVKN